MNRHLPDPPEDGVTGSWSISSISGISGAISQAVGEATSLPSQFRADYQITEDVGLEIVVTVSGGAIRCTSVRAYAIGDKAEITARHLRERKLELLIEHACKAVASLPTPDDPLGAIESREDARKAEGDIRSGRKTARGRGYTDELLSEVAEVYIAAERYPTKAVREVFGVKQSTAQLYVKKAREAGHLPPVEKGKQ